MHPCFHVTPSVSPKVSVHMQACESVKMGQFTLNEYGHVYAVHFYIYVLFDKQYICCVAVRCARSILRWEFNIYLRAGRAIWYVLSYERISVIFSHVISQMVYFSEKKGDVWYNFPRKIYIICYEMWLASWFHSAFELKKFPASIGLVSYILHLEAVLVKWLVPPSKIWLFSTDCGFFTAQISV